MTKDEAIAELRGAMQGLIEFFHEAGYDCSRAIKAMSDTAASLAPSSEPVQHQIRMRAPNGHVGPWHDCDKPSFDRYRFAPDIGDGFSNETRALYAEAPAAPAVAVPEDMALVPREPTEAMVHAAEDIPAPRPFGKVWRAMISAAPAAPLNTQPVAEQIANWLRRNANAEQSPGKRAAFIEAHNAARTIISAPLNTAAPTEPQGGKS